MVQENAQNGCCHARMELVLVAMFHNMIRNTVVTMSLIVTWDPKSSADEVEDVEGSSIMGKAPEPLTVTGVGASRATGKYSQVMAYRRITTVMGPFRVFLAVVNSRVG